MTGMIERIDKPLWGYKNGNWVMLGDHYYVQHDGLALPRIVLAGAS